MKYFLIMSLLFLSSQSATATDTVGFVLNEKMYFPAFAWTGKKWQPISEPAKKKLISKNLNIFFDGKNLGEVKIVRPYKECFKKYSPEETASSKNCDPFESIGKSVDPTGPCPGDLKEQVSCPLAESENVATITSPIFFESKLSDQNSTQIRNAFGSKKTDWQWGAFVNLKSHERPLLAANAKLADPDGWHHIDFNQIPKDIQQKIFNTVLGPRKIQKCTEESSKIKSIQLSEKDLKIGRVYQNKKLDKYAIAIDIKDIKGLAECDGNEMGIPSAYVIYADDKATDLLKAMDWNYRGLELLEAADVNGDGISELYFIDYQYNYDGFSVFDFKTGTLVKNGSSSH